MNKKKFCIQYNILAHYLNQNFKTTVYSMNTVSTCDLHLKFKW